MFNNLVNNWLPQQEREPAMFGKEKKNSTSKGPAAVFVGSYPDLAYVWPTIALPYLFWLCEKTGIDIAATTQGWWYLSAWVLIAMVIGLDFNRNVLLFTLGIIGGLFGLNYWFENAKEILILGTVYKFFGQFDPTVSLDFMLVLSHILLILYIIMMFVVRFDNRYRVTQNEIEHHRFGYRDDAVARAGKRLKMQFPDLLETLLCGSGTIVVLSTTGGKVIMDVPNVPFLVFRMKKISRLWESMSTTVDEIAAAAEEAEEGTE